MDEVFIEGLMVYAYHGATDEEQQVGRPYRIDAWLSVDTRAAGASHSLDETVDYGRASAVLAEAVSGEPCRLVEAVAERAAAAVLRELPLVRMIRLRIAKLAPPTGYVSEAAGVEITRTRETG